MTRKFKVTERSLAARQVAIEEMARYCLWEWTFSFNSSVRRLGCCFYPFRCKPGRIELSTWLCEFETPEKIRETILHEIAHALVGPGHKHGPVWQAKAIEMGIPPERCASVTNIPHGKWSAECKACGHIYYRHNKPSSEYSYWCKRCLETADSLEWVLSLPTPVS